MEVKRKRLSFLSTWFLQKLEILKFPAALSGKQGRPPPNGCRKLKVFWRPWKWWNSLKSVDVAGEICDRPTEWLFWLWEIFQHFNLRSLMKSSNPTNLKEAKWSINQTYSVKQIGLNLATFGKSEVNFREKKLCFSGY